MSIINFRPEIWSANLLVAYRKNLVFGDLVNHDYEGEITQAGDTVRITSVGRPTIATYVPNSTVISPEQVQDSQRTLVVDQAKYFAFAVDDVDQRQARGNVIPQSVNEAGYGISDVMDQYVASLYPGAQAANQLGAIALSQGTPTGAYDSLLIPLKVQMDLANVPTEGRWVVVRPEVHALLLRDQRFITAYAAGDAPGADALRNGHVGRAAGFDIRVSNNAPNVTGSQYAAVAGTNAAITFAQQINQMEAYRPQSSFSDAVKGLVLYGAKLVRPDALATALVTVGA